MRKRSSSERFKERIAEVLRKYNVTLESAPLDALAMAMAHMAANDMTRITQTIWDVYDKTRGQSTYSILRDIAREIRGADV